MNYTKILAGAFVGAGALLLIWKGNITEGATLLGGMLGFFVGDANGQNTAKKQAQATAAED